MKIIVIILTLFTFACDTEFNTEPGSKGGGEGRQQPPQEEYSWNDIPYNHEKWWKECEARISFWPAQIDTLRTKEFVLVDSTKFTGYYIQYANGNQYYHSYYIVAIAKENDFTLEWNWVIRLEPDMLYYYNYDGTVARDINMAIESMLVNLHFNDEYFNYNIENVIRDRVQRYYNHTIGDLKNSANPFLYFDRYSWTTNYDYNDDSQRDMYMLKVFYEDEYDPIFGDHIGYKLWLSVFAPRSASFDLLYK